MCTTSRRPSVSWYPTLCNQSKGTSYRISGIKVTGTELRKMKNESI
jgi:hypothetical protein